MAAEKYVSAFHHVYGLRTTCLRYFNVYGPRQVFGPYSGVINIFINQLLKNEVPVIHGDGEQVRDFTYIQDVVKANILAMKKKAAGKVFNIATGKPTTINQLAEILLKITEKDQLKPIHGEARPGDIRKSFADIGKANDVLGYFPDVTLEDGLSRFIEWRKANPNRS